jgi:hypothetical protein
MVYRELSAIWLERIDSHTVVLFQATYAYLDYRCATAEHVSNSQSARLVSVSIPGLATATKYMSQAHT